MANIFIDIFNMSITASYLVFAVVVARLLLKKAPKWINCLLWALVGIRLICPFSFESALSLIPSSQTISVNNSSTGRPFTVQSGVPAVDTNINQFLGDKYYEGVTVPTNTFADMTTILSIIWLVGLFAMLLYGMISYLKLHKQVGASLLFNDDIYYCDNIDTPFILGFFKPKIYVPSGITEEQISYISLHEKAHIKRKDHWWKPLGFILLSVYWFNPVMWVAYILLCRDIETACDEKVIKNMPNNEKKGYSETLVSCSVQRKMVMACPLAFGEVGVKQRVKAVLNYKKPAFWVIVIAIIVTVAVSVGFLTNPGKNNFDDIAIIGGADGPTSIIVGDKKEINELKKKYPHFFSLDTSEMLTVYITAIGLDKYKCYLSSNKNPVDPQEIMSFSEFAEMDEMNLILSSYDIPECDIEIVPFQHSLSSSYWEDMYADVEYLGMLLGISDRTLKTFNATVVEVAPQGIIVEPFENEPERHQLFSRVLVPGVFSDVINATIRVVYDGGVIHTMGSYPNVIGSVIAVYGVDTEKESSKPVNVNIDVNLLDFSYNENTFLKEMNEYEARVVQSDDSTKISVVFSESQYSNFMTDKYKQVEAYYNGIGESEEGFIFKKVEYDEDFRNLKIYVDESQRQYISSLPEYGIAQNAFNYQMFLAEGVGVNVDVIDYKTNKVVWSFTLPEKNN